jgi:hypothetical protein
MKEKIVQFNSYWGVTLENEYIDQGSDILTVILPGQCYMNCSPLMHYSSKIAQELGLDVLSIDYGFQISKGEFEFEKELNIVINESSEILQKCLKKEYKKIIFIGKSLGTIIQNKLSEEFADYEQLHIYLTPVNQSLESVVNETCLAVIGMEDKNVNKENIKKIEGMKNITLLKVDGADSFLESSDTIKSIRIMSKTFEILKEFLCENLEEIREYKLG